ncbi:MAG: hypothetical protein AAGB15_14070 [Pseudomonadota bacterium]
MPLASLHETRDGALEVESAGPPDISRATFRAIRHDRHPMGRWCDLIAPNAVRSQSSAITIPGPAPKYGQHTRAILAELGLREDETDDMIENGIAAERWSDRYLPH